MAELPKEDGFAKFFAGSKLVDANALPLRLYHGTRSDITSFVTSRGGEYGSGIYLTADEGSAWQYAERARGSAGQHVMPVYVCMRNPYFATCRDDARSKGVKKLMELGYDGIIATGSTGEMQIVAFKPEQVKSAIGNSGTYDPLNSDIRASVPANCMGAPSEEVDAEPDAPLFAG